MLPSIPFLHGGTLKKLLKTPFVVIPGGLRLSWRRLFRLSVLAIYAYLFMEWLFFATKPSFMDAMPLGKKLEVFLLSGLVLVILALPVLLALRLLGWMPVFLKKGQVFLFAAAVVPALLAAATSLLMIDNFTYTVFKFGIVTSVGVWRGVYGLLAVILLVVWYRQGLLWISSPGAEPGARSGRSLGQIIQTGLGIGLVACSLVVGLGRDTAQAAQAGEKQATINSLPNIILIGSDGVTANRMSLYAYKRDTTPRLVQLAQTGLLAENNFTNAAATTGSVFSILTGKYPTTTRLLYSPNILHGLDAYQHLPGILQRAGYTTVEISFPYYVDAYAINMQEGFDEVNGRKLAQDSLSQFTRRFNFEDVGYFLPRLTERIFDRLQHIFYIRSMPDPYRQVIDPVDPNLVDQLSDGEKIFELVQLLANAKSPLFVHVHLMGTHGEKFDPQNQVFSAGETQSADWMRDFYDDSVLDFDGYVGELVDGLAHRGLLDQTVIVVYSDHADQWRSDDRIPLLFRFPNGEFAGRIRNNTQNLDIAPTLLDYLGMQKPAWMAGQSLLRQEPPATRPIISAGVVDVNCEPPDWWCVINPKKSSPPFYQFGYIQLTVCQKMWTVYLDSLEWASAEVPGHTAPCQQNDLPDEQAAHKIVIEHLRQNGFDVGKLR